MSEVEFERRQSPTFEVSTMRLFSRLLFPKRSFDTIPAKITSNPSTFLEPSSSKPRTSLAKKSQPTAYFAFLIHNSLDRRLYLLMRVTRQRLHSRRRIDPHLAGLLDQGSVELPRGSVAFPRKPGPRKLHSAAQRALSSVPDGLFDSIPQLRQPRPRQ